MISSSIINPSNTQECPECCSNTITQSGGERYCTQCGHITQERQVQTKETKNYSRSEARKNKRTGSKISYLRGDQGMRTTIGYNGEINKVNPRKAGQYKRLQRWQGRKDSSARNKDALLTIIKQQADDFDLPSQVLEEAARTAWKCYEEGITVGRNRDMLALGIIHLVSREFGYGIPLTELADYYPDKDTKVRVGRAYREVARTLERSYAPLTPSDVVYRYGSLLEMSDEEISEAAKLCKKAEDIDRLSGVSPLSIAGACLYIGSLLTTPDDYAKQSEIEEEVGVSQVSLRKNYKKISQELGLEERIEEAR